ncbi:MAG: cytochrome c biogenesis protein CcdA [Candidatus Omnitrophica bacterium]|nr:cytochrome c biogenesis protein CcdA [Candidatus Omnitrophota bacterium]
MQLSGSPIDYLLAFLGGILVSFTPCIYPLIPISASYIGISSSGSKLKGLSLGLVYVTGVAVTYSILGLIASLSGKIFGSFSTNPVTYLVVGIIIIIFGLSMLDFFALNFPIKIKLPVSTKKGYLSGFIFGLVSGLVVSPCLTPVLGSILAYLAAKKNLLYGATLLFTFAFGMGFVLIVIGFFSAALINLPKSGKWLKIIKVLFAIVLIGMGGYFIYLSIRSF